MEMKALEMETMRDVRMATRLAVVVVYQQRNKSKESSTGPERKGRVSK